MTLPVPSSSVVVPGIGICGKNEKIGKISSVHKFTNKDSTMNEITTKLPSLKHPKTNSNSPGK